MKKILESNPVNKDAISCNSDSVECPFTACRAQTDSKKMVNVVWVYNTYVAYGIKMKNFRNETKIDFFFPRRKIMEYFMESIKKVKKLIKKKNLNKLLKLFFVQQEGTDRIN